MTKLEVVLRRWPLWLALAGCARTVDSLGYNDTDAGLDAEGGSEAGLEDVLWHPLTGPASYPNALRDLLGKSEQEIEERIKAVFEQLFYGDPVTEAIYFRVAPDKAYIPDVLHGDVRSEGIGYGMMIAVQLDRRQEFDRLWTYARSALEYQSGPNRGYFASYCDAPAGPSPCVDPFGHQQFITALLFAHGRWGTSPGGIDYQADAGALLAAMRHQEDRNGGVVDGVTNMVDAESKLVLDEPKTSAAGRTRPSILMPAYYELWAQATGDSFWNEAAAAARAHWRQAAHPSTGLMPVRTRFDGTPVADGDRFEPEGYRAQLNLVLDQVWFGTDGWQVEEANRLLGFFHGQGIDQYCKVYTVDGATCVDSHHEPSLVAVNGATALVATREERKAFVEAAWNLETPTGGSRYYAGLLDLLALLVLGGKYRVY